MNRPALISVFSDQRRTKSTTRSRTSCGTHTLVRAPQDFFLRPCAQPSIRPAPHPSSGSSFPGTRSVVVRLGGPDGSWTGRQPPRSRRTLFANGRTPLAAAPVPHTDRKPALYPANAVLGCQPSLPQCSASALFACVLSVILTEERSLQFQLRQDSGPDRSRYTDSWVHPRDGYCDSQGEGYTGEPNRPGLKQRETYADPEPGPWIPTRCLVRA